MCEYSVSTVYEPKGKVTKGFSKPEIKMARPIIGLGERRAVDKVLRSGALAQGARVLEFEGQFSQLVSGRPCVATNSGTSALHIAMLALGIGPGDEVIVPSFTFAATANSVALTGATPVFVDIDRDIFTMDPTSVEAAITPKTRAVLPVHLYGHMADMTRISEIARKNDLLMLEDAAQAHLATWDGKPAGAWGDAAAFSFYPTKNMTTGEGGMIALSDKEVERRSRLYRNQGMEIRYQNEVVGLNNRMTEIEAAIGLVQLKKLARWTSKRQSNAKFLSENIDQVVTPKIAAEATHVFHQYTVKVEGHHRDEFAAELKRRGVGCDVYYPIPVHRLPSFDSKVDLPITEQIKDVCLSLPVHPSLTKSDLNRIVETVNSVAKAGS
jgi:dTDP-4-amino-4,6-dideoxygalactose transaminase